MVEVSKCPDKEMWIVKFTCAALPGHFVALAGVFNDWDPVKNPMSYSDSDQVYACSLKLAAGTYEYKLVFDGEWQLDDGNPNFVSNDFGTLNSVVKVG